jgi:hypothetical protein
MKVHPSKMLCPSKDCHSSPLMSSPSLSPSTIALLAALSPDVGGCISTSLVAACFSTPSYISESTLGRLLDCLLGDPAPLFTLLAFDDDDGLVGPVIVAPFPLGGCSHSRSQDTPSTEPGGSGEDTCIEIFGAGGLFDKKSSQDASYGSAAIAVQDQTECQISEMPERHTEL